MTDHNSEHGNGFFYRLEGSALIAVIAIILLFSTAISVILIAPKYIDPAWTQPSSYYQVQMYRISQTPICISVDPFLFSILTVYLPFKGWIYLLAFSESANTRIVAPPELEKYITHFQEPKLKLTSRLLLLKHPDPTQESKEGEFNGYQAAEALRKQLKARRLPKKIKACISTTKFWSYSNLKNRKLFRLPNTDGVMENFVDANYMIFEEDIKVPYHRDPGVIFVKNPQEYLVNRYKVDGDEEWKQDKIGEPIKNVAEIREKPFRFPSREPK